MTERITRQDVAHVADLARLSLTDDELDAFTIQLADIEADVDGIDEIIASLYLYWVEGVEVPGDDELTDVAG